MSQARLQQVQSDRFVAVWNANCTPLPRLRKAPTIAGLVRLINRALDAVDDDAELARAVQRAARNEYYRKERYGWETFARHVDRWLDSSAAVNGLHEPNGATMSAEQREFTERQAAILREQTREAEARVHGATA